MAEERTEAAGEAGWRNLNGAPAYIDVDGTILAGCEGLEGYDVDELDATREDRDAAQEAAEAAGWRPAEVERAQEIYDAAKPQHPGEFLVVRIGDKLRTFGEEATVALDLLQMGDGEVAEFDREHLETHLGKLTGAGYRVQIVEQTAEGDHRPQFEVGPEHAAAIEEGAADGETEPDAPPIMEEPDESAPQAPPARPFDAPLEELPTIGDTRRGEQEAYRDEEGNVKASSRTTPAPWQGEFPVGTWRVDRSWEGNYGHAIERLEELDPFEIELSESDYYATKDNPEGRGWDSDRYAEWIVQGLEPPPITVIQTESGKLRASDGHRRLGAIKKAAERLGRPINVKAWVSRIADTGKKDWQGNPIYTSQTYQTAIRDAAARGEELPEHAQQELAKWQAKNPQSFPPSPETADEAPDAGDAAEPDDLTADLDFGFGPEDFEDDEAADAQAHLEAAPPAVRSFVEAMQQLPAVQAGGAGFTDDLSPQFAQAMHGYLSGLPGGQDGYGESYDLSEQLGPGAIGYHSPAGVFALVPPQYRGGTWEARYSPDAGDAAEPPAAEEMDVDFDPLALEGDDEGNVAEPTPSPDLAPMPALGEVDDGGFGGFDDFDDFEEAPARPPVLTGPDPLKQHPDLARAAKEYYPDNLEAQRYLVELAVESHRPHAELMDRLKQGRRALLDEISKHTGSIAARLRKAQHGGKETSQAIRGYDELIEDHEWKWPEMFVPWHVDSRGLLRASPGSGEGGRYTRSDKEAALLENLARTNAELTPPPKDMFIGDAIAALEGRSVGYRYSLRQGGRPTHADG